jgi:hypothetical protein
MLATKNQESFVARLADAEAEIARLRKVTEKDLYNIQRIRLERDNARAIEAGLRAEASQAKLELADSEAHVKALVETLKGAAKWCHEGHGCFPAKQCGLCKPVLVALEGELSERPETR